MKEPRKLLSFVDQLETYTLQCVTGLTRAIESAKFCTSQWILLACIKTCYYFYSCPCVLYGVTSVSSSSWSTRYFDSNSVSRILYFSVNLAYLILTYYYIFRVLIALLLLLVVGVLVNLFITFLRGNEQPLSRRLFSHWSVCCISWMFWTGLNGLV